MKKAISLKLMVYGLIVISLTITVLTFSCAKKKPFNIGFNEWVGFAPFFLAKEKGYYGDLDVQMNFIALEGDKRAGLYADRFQMICETMDMFQTERDTIDYPGKIIFAVDESYGADGVLAIEGIKTLKDLKGRTVVSEPGLPAHFVLQYLLHQEGMTLKDVELTPMTSSDAAHAFIAGKADVAGTYEPYLSKALSERNGAHLLVSSRDLPGFIIDVAIVNEKTLRERKSDAEKVFIGWCKAVKYLENNPEDAIEIMAKAFKLPPEEFKETIAGLRYFSYERSQQLFGTPESKGPIFETFETVGIILKENNLTKATASAEEKIDLTIVKTPIK